MQYLRENFINNFWAYFHIREENKSPAGHTSLLTTFFLGPFMGSVNIMKNQVFSGFLYPDSKYEIISYNILPTISIWEKKLKIIMKIKI